jgi:hypothetical protein
MSADAPSAKSTTGMLGSPVASMCAISVLRSEELTCSAGNDE